MNHQYSQSLTTNHHHLHYPPPYSHTMQWDSLRSLFRMPRHDAAIMILVTCLSVTVNLAAGIAAGVSVAAVLHVWRTGMALTARATVGQGPEKQARKVYHLRQPLFFGSTR